MDATTTPTQDAGALPPKSAPRAIELCLSSLKDEITTLVKNEQSYQQTVQSLQSELSAYKRAYTDADADLQVAKNALHEARALNVQLKAEASRQHDKGTRVVILIDGDGAIFSTQLISQGQKGGHAAAQQITDKVTQALVGEYGARTYQLWAYVFFNRQGLLMTFKRSGLTALNAKLDDFVSGFNQATERFIMVDVGNTKEAADAKLKVYLEAELRLTETFKVVFGGCHDNGYVANLHSQITAGFKEKLILLKSYDEMAAGIATLARELPTLTIADLFMAQKLVDAVPAAAGQRKPSPPLSGNVSLGPTEKTALPSPATSVAPRQLDPKLPMSKQRPAPCTLYYLKNSCTLGTSCSHAHDYILTATQLAEFAKGAKRAPCPSVNKGKECNFGAECCYAHVCPKHPNCPFHKHENCKFKHATMHPSK